VRILTVMTQSKPVDLAEFASVSEDLMELELYVDDPDVGVVSDAFKRKKIEKEEGKVAVSGGQDARTRR
jgi:hypothetical protein